MRAYYTTSVEHTLHGLSANASNDFRVQKQADTSSSVTQTTGTFATLLASSAAISLIVGGIGIMNIQKPCRVSPAGRK